MGGQSRASTAAHACCERRLTLFLPQTLVMFVLMTTHALFHLLCHWLVWFRVQALYIPAAAVEPGTFVQVNPKAHRGASSIEEVRA